MTTLLESSTLRDFADTSTDLHIITVDGEGRIEATSAGARHWLHRDEEALRGRHLGELCVSQDEPALARLTDPAGPPAGDLRLSLVDGLGRPYTVHMSFRREGGRTVLVGVPDSFPLHELQEQMVAANNALAELARETERERRELDEVRSRLAEAHQELAEAHEELESSYWHLKKIQEVLPICMRCSRVNTGDGRWQSVAEFLKENSLFLSHGYCPDCKEALLAEYRLNRFKSEGQ